VARQRRRDPRENPTCATRTGVGKLFMRICLTQHSGYRLRGPDIHFRRQPASGFQCFPRRGIVGAKLVAPVEQSEKKPWAGRSCGFSSNWQSDPAPPPTTRRFSWFEPKAAVPTRRAPMQGISGRRLPARQHRGVKPVDTGSERERGSADVRI
jgi:hypothetical protein